MFEFLLFDNDGTLMDFDRAEEIALQQTLSPYGAAELPDIFSRYHRINDNLWLQIERGAFDKKNISRRFALLFEEYGLALDADRIDAEYREALSGQAILMDGAAELLEALHPNYRLFLVTNGIERTQKARFAAVGFDRIFENCFISGSLGVSKPSKAFFDVCFSQIPGFAPERALMIGDRLTSDIRGGNNAGIRTCWFNPAGLSNQEGVRVDYEIRSLSELKPILSQE